ncbi:MAG: hypothetical protein GTN69_00095 [Armatimonadetes bacterium]|nr:hypothetical protein [Armatimonadota bacterium]NIO74313.1 hypothetical protein [Armatimonadota bacterium]NIO95520.1 hypothetical protein [Armatimonadota bacterium]
MKRMSVLVVVVALALLFILSAVSHCEDVDYMWPAATLSSQWLGYPSGWHSHALVDGFVIQPSIPDTSNYVYCYRWLRPLRQGGIGVDTYVMDNPGWYPMESWSPPSDFISEIKLWAYYYRPTSGGGIMGSIRFNRVPGGIPWLPTKSFPDVGPNKKGWRSVTFTPEPGTFWPSADIRCLEVWLENQPPPVGKVKVYALYAEITFGPRSLIRPNGGTGSCARYPSGMEVWQVLSDEDHGTYAYGGGGGELEIEEAGTASPCWHTHGIEIWVNGAKGDLGGAWVWTNLEGATEQKHLPLSSTPSDCHVSYDGCWSQSEIDDMTVGFGMNHETSLNEIWVTLDICLEMH